jgi:hypothetical protein
MMRKRRGVNRAWLALAVLFAACGDGVDADDPSRYTLIDDMEGDVNQIDWPATEGRLPGGWGPATDCTQADRISPPPRFVELGALPYEALPAAYETLPGVTSEHAIRLRTTAPLVGVWGANIVLSLAGSDPSSVRMPAAVPDGQPCTQDSALNYPAPTVDLTAYAGITFWAKVEPGSMRTLRVQVLDRNVDPRGGVCNAATPDEDGDCYNGYSALITLTDTLTRYTVPFDTLAQNPTWGFKPTPPVLDLAHVYVMNFEFDAPVCTANDTLMCAGGATPPLSFDFWLDDLYFVNAR